jgi:hypothetical protein
VTAVEAIAELRIGGTFNFADPPQRAKLTPLMGSINAAGAAERDAAAFLIRTFWLGLHWLN